MNLEKHRKLGRLIKDARAIIYEEQCRLLEIGATKKELFSLEPA